VKSAKSEELDGSSYESDSYDCGRAETCVAENGNPILLTELKEKDLSGHHNAN